MSINRAINRISGGIISFFMNQFLRLFYILFLLAGLLCAIISGLIEYRVFAELYPKIDPPGPFYLSLAFLIVLSLETTKVFLVFFHKQCIDTLNAGYMVDRQKFTFLRTALIVTSAVCTLIFSFYNLHNPAYDKQLALKRNEANADYERKLRHIDTEFEKRLKGIDEEVALWREKLAMEAQRVSGGVAEGPRYRAYQKQYDEAVKRLDGTRTRLEQQRFERIRELETVHDQNMRRLEEDLKSARSVHNRFLSATLSVLNMSPSYPQWQYMTMIFFLSLLLSIALESVIVCSFKVLAIYHGDLFELDIHRKTSQQTWKTLDETAEGLHEAELKSLRQRILREKANAIDTLKQFIGRRKNHSPSH